MSCSIPDATCSKPSPCSFLSRCCHHPIPSDGKLRHSLWLSLPPTNPWFLSPFDSTFLVFQSESPFVATAPLFSKASAFPIGCCQGSRVSALTPVCCQSGPASPSRVHHRWVTRWFRLLSYVPSHYQIHFSSLAWHSPPHQRGQSDLSLLFIILHSHSTTASFLWKGFMSFCSWTYAPALSFPGMPLLPFLSIGILLICPPRVLSSKSCPPRVALPAQTNQLLVSFVIGWDGEDTPSVPQFAHLQTRIGIVPPL